MKRQPQIVLVDDHLLFRQSLKSILTIRNIAKVSGEASNGFDLIRLLPELKPDIVMMDINMPYMNGMEATYNALKLMPDLKIIAYTMFGEEEYFNKMIALGIKGFIVKSCSIEDVEKAIKAVMNGKTFFAPNFQIPEKMINQNDISPNGNWSAITEDHIKSKTS